VGGIWRPTMDALYQLSYNGALFVPLPTTCSGTDQVVFEGEREDSRLRLATFSNLEDDPVFTIDLATFSLAILG